ncbi:MAG: AAA family ATPase [Spirochaetia bacterium]|jgi:cytidylate kinase|nr:AAA family ATPase [Spirochaetia bacterium]
MLNKITIAISGKSGCGNTTISKMVAKKLNLKFINYTFRKMAEEKGISFEELRLLAEESTAIDMELDKQQVHLAAEGNCVLGSRLAIWMIDRADLKVYLTAPPSVRAGRIANRENGTLDEKIAETEDRDQKDSARYKKIYAIDTNKYDFADLIIDTDNNNESEVVALILEAVESLQ